jgi:hypothetical protein
MHAVRDLYDTYAADPLGVGVSPSGHSQTKARAKFFERYIDRQAEIESLLEKKQRTQKGLLPGALVHAGPLPAPGGGGGGGAQGSVTDDMRDEDSLDLDLDLDDFDLELERELCGEDQQSEPVAGPDPGDEIKAEMPSRPFRFKVAARTPNTELRDNDTVSCRDWSGGVLFAPSGRSQFKLTVAPQDPLETHPIFIGIAPFDADLTIVNFFDVGGGVFLCMGGQSSGSLLAARGAPGGPAFYALGERTVADLPLMTVGHTVMVQYSEDDDGSGEVVGQVRFSLGDDQGHGIFHASPPLPRKLRAGRWRPCLLICVPGARVRVLRLR